MGGVPVMGGGKPAEMATSSSTNIYAVMSEELQGSNAYVTRNCESYLNAKSLGTQVRLDLIVDGSQL